jgi:hypothetical protein
VVARRFPHQQENPPQDPERDADKKKGAVVF